MMDLIRLEGRDREIVQGMRDLLSDPEKWTTNHMARDRYGAPISPWSEGATCWCAYGAVQVVTDPTGWVAHAEDVMQLLDNLIPIVLPDARTEGGAPIDSVITVNDQLGHGAIMQILDYALEHGVPSPAGVPT